MTALTLVQKPIKWGDGNLVTTAQFATDGTNFWPLSVLVDANGNVGTGQNVGLTTGAPTSSLTRPSNTTAYAAGQLIGSNLVAGSLVVPSFSVPANTPIISALRLWTNVTTGWAGAIINMNLWTAAPTYSNPDGGAYAVATGAGSWIGQFSVSLNQFADGASGRAGVSNGPAIVLPASLTTVYWDMQIFSAITPISGQVFHLTAEMHG
jgi:hypothetical protein